MRRNELAHATQGALAIAAIVAPLRLEADRFAKAFPEFLLEGADREHLPICRGVEIVAGAVPHQSSLAITEPVARREALSERKRHESEEILRHGDVKMATGAAHLALTKRQENVHHRRIAATADIRDKRGGHDGRFLRSEGEREQAGIADIV